MRAATGFAIVGMPPIGHAPALPTFLAADLRRYAVPLMAAGRLTHAPLVFNRS